MLYGILVSLLSSLHTLSFKRACVAAEGIGLTSMQLYFSVNVMAFVLTWVAMVCLPHDTWGDIFRSFLDLGVFATLLLVSVFWFASEVIEQVVFAREKVSVILPYMETTSFFTVLLGYIFLHEHIATLTFVVAVVASIALILASVDFRAFTFNRYCALQLAASLLDAFVSVLVAHALVSVGEFSVMIFTLVFDIVVSTVVLVATRELIALWRRTDTRETMFAIFLNDVTWVLHYLLLLFLVKEFGVIVTALLSMLEVALTLILSYMFFREVPSRRDLVLTVFVTACVVVGSLA